VSDVPRLLDWCGPGGLLRPDADLPNTVDLARALATIGGAPDVPLTANARRIGELIGEGARHVVFVLTDGLGMHLIDTLPADAFLRRHVGMELRSVFPSGTPAALTSIATASWPAEHAVTGWFLHLPREGVTTTILPYIDRFSKQPLSGIDRASALPVPSAMARFTRRTAAFLPRPLCGSVYSQYFNGGAEEHPYDSLAAAVDGIAAHDATMRAPAYSYLYVPHVDTVQHEHGVASQQARSALAATDAALQALRGRLPADARIVVTADHGQISVDPDEALLIEDGGDVMETLRMPPTGDPRVLMCHVRGGRTGDFEQAFRARYGEHFVLLTAREAEDLRLFGPVALTAETRARVGDYVAIADAASVLLYQPEDRLRGVHGGLHRDEMRVPLIVA
jgi:hypothetical protein